MASTFNPQILVEKLAKLNNSQASIETLSHWCIFHMNKAKQVVETWDRQFHCSPQEQRLAFLYLANDILQNSRRKGSEFVGEFWKVLPDALRDVIENGDDFGRNAALRLIGIWEERKVFGSRGQILKEELLGKHLDSNAKNGKPFVNKLRQFAGIPLDKIVSGYQAVYGGQIDEDAILSKCRNSVHYLEKVDKDIGGDINSGQFHGSPMIDEMQEHQAVLRDSIEQLRVVESSRSSLVSHLREALQDQEFKLNQVRSLLQVAQSQSERTGNFFQQLLNGDNVHPIPEQRSKEAHNSIASQSYTPGDREQSAPVLYSGPTSFPGKPGLAEEDPRKSAAAAVAAKLTASTSSAQMLSYVLSSLASEGVISNPVKESSGDFPSGKRAKPDGDATSYVLPQNSQQPAVSSFKHSEVLQQSVSTTSQQYTPKDLPPPPSSSPPPMPPPPPIPQFPLPQYMQQAASSGMPYGYSMAQPLQPPLTTAAYSTIGAPVTGISPYTMPTNSYQSFQGSDANFYSQPSSVPMAPISRQ